MNTMPCSATVMERLTDAGTKPYPPVPRDEDDGRDRAEEVWHEAEHICRVIALGTKDVGCDGLVRHIRLDNEIAAGVIDREATVAELVRLVCARRINAIAVTDAEIAAVIERAVIDEVDMLAESRVAE